MGHNEKWQYILII